MSGRTPVAASGTAAEPEGEHQVPVRVVRTACGDHFLRGDVDALDAHPADEADVVAVEPAGAVEIEVGLAPA